MSEAKAAKPTEEKKAAPKRGKKSKGPASSADDDK
jgi:hypothetical protein